MKKKLQKFIKNRDLIGHNFKLKYNGDDIHKTLLGGTISSFVLALMLWITYGKSFSMVTHGNDSL